MKINVDYLMKLAYDDLSDDQILRGYMEFYFCQGRNIGDLFHDYMRLRRPKYVNICYEMMLITPEQIRTSIKRVRKVIDVFLDKQFDLKSTDEIEK